MENNNLYAITQHYSKLNEVKKQTFIFILQEIYKIQSDTESPFCFLPNEDNEEILSFDKLTDELIKIEVIIHIFDCNYGLFTFLVGLISKTKYYETIPKALKRIFALKSLAPDSINRLMSLFNAIILHNLALCRLKEKTEESVVLYKLKEQIGNIRPDLYEILLTRPYYGLNIEEFEMVYGIYDLFI